MGRQVASVYGAEFDWDHRYDFPSSLHAVDIFGAQKKRKKLIEAIVICGGVTAYALGDMMIYNRRKRAQFYEEQKGLYAAALHNARLAIAEGRASEEDIDFVKRDKEEAVRIEKIKAEKEAKKAKKGIFAIGKEWLFYGLKKEEEGEFVGTSDRRIGYESLSEEDDGMGVRESDIVRAIEDKKGSIETKVKKAFAEEKERQRFGGPLDRLGTSVTESTGSEDSRPKSGGWTSFMTRR
jgi:hypothetical protein